MDNGARTPDAPEGSRSGSGADSILPYLMESLRTKVQAPLEPDDALQPPPGPLKD